MSQSNDHIEFIYVMNLNRKIFTMNNEVHFLFCKIPRFCWIKSLSLNEFEERTSIPRLVSKNSLASLIVLNNDMHDDLTSISHMSVEFVKSKKALNFFRHCRLKSMLFIYQIWLGFQQKLEAQMWYTLLRTLPTDFVFREIAFDIVFFAISLSNAIRFEDNRRCKKSLHSDSQRCQRLSRLQLICLNEIEQCLTCFKIHYTKSDMFLITLRKASFFSVFCKSVNYSARLTTCK